MSLSTSSNRFWDWLVSFTFPYPFNYNTANLGLGLGFIFGITNGLVCSWVFYFLPETRGRTLDESEEMFENGMPARKYCCEFDRISF